MIDGNGIVEWSGIGLIDGEDCQRWGRLPKKKKLFVTRCVTYSQKVIVDIIAVGVQLLVAIEKESQSAGYFIGVGERDNIRERERGGKRRAEARREGRQGEKVGERGRTGERARERGEAGGEAYGE